MLDGVNLASLAAQVLNVTLILGWIVLLALILRSLSHRKMENTARALWALTIVLVPILGAAAYFLACCRQ